MQGLTFRSLEAYLIVAAVYIALTALFKSVFGADGARELRLPASGALSRCSRPSRSATSNISRRPASGRSCFGVALVGGAVLGGRWSRSRASRRGAPVRFLAQTYLFIIQGTPLLVLLFIAYFGVAFAGFDVPPLAAAAFAFTLYAGAFLGDIWRGAVQAVGAGQWEAAAALGLRLVADAGPGHRAAGGPRRGAADARAFACNW